MVPETRSEAPQRQSQGRYLAPELSAAYLLDVPVLADGDERGLVTRLERIQLVGIVRQ